MLQGWRMRALLAAAAALLACSTSANAASLYDGRGPRPGPDILYADPPRAPQLENTGPWQAPPILVSGATAYRSGEFLYQDYLYDDHGARYTRDPNDPRSGDDTFSESNGTYRYPTNAAFAQNGADLVEFRVKPTADATLFRLTLNTLIDARRVGAVIAIGDSVAPLPMPDGANTTVPAQYFLTWHGDTAVLRNAATGTQIAPAAVTIDADRRQVQISIPHSAWDPGTGTWKMAAGLGVWDPEANQFAQPQQFASDTRPGGGVPGASAFFNVAFRTAEPVPDVGDTASLLGNPSWWRDRQQGEQLRAGSLASFRADVDFGKLAAGVNDDSGVPQTGVLNRIYASRFETKQGVDFDYSCGNADECKGELRGQLQPYALYVPTKHGPNGYGLTLALHSLGAGYNQFSGSRNQSQWGERGSGSVVLTPSGRGPDGWYYDQAGADTFEAWADVARHYPLDADYTSIGGYSMGGYGTYKFATQFPDLFARAQPTVGPPGLGVATTPDNPSGGRQTSTFPMLPSLRNIPIQMWVAVSDELVPFTGTQLQARGLDDLDYRYEFWAFAPAEHLTLAAFDQYEPSAAFLGDARVDRNPAHVTYVRNDTMDFPDDATKADHAYWLSNIAVSNRESSPFGTIDVRSEGFGVSDPAAGETQNDAGQLTGGHLAGTLGYQRQRKSWGSVPRAAARDRLVIDAKNVSTVDIDPVRARVSCNAELVVTSDSPLSVKLAGCPQGRQVFGQAAACGAKGLPRSSVSRGIRGSRKRGITATGRAIAFKCVNQRRRPGTVARVEVAIARKSGKRCRYVNSRGRLGRARACDKNDWLRARLGRQRGGKVPWTFRSKRAKLPRGVYELRVRAIDKTGTVEKQPRRQARKRFKVR
jgi:hypothetical protein